MDPETLRIALAATQQLTLNVVPPGDPGAGTIIQSSGADGHGAATAIVVEGGVPLFHMIGQIASRGWRLVTVTNNEHLGFQFYYSRA